MIGGEKGEKKRRKCEKRKRENKDETKGMKEKEKEGMRRGRVVGDTR